MNNKPSREAMRQEIKRRLGIIDIVGVEPHYQIILDRKAALDELTLLVEVSKEIFTGQMSLLMDLENTNQITSTQR